jgi:hypothetical protein
MISNTLMKFTSKALKTTYKLIRILLGNIQPVPELLPHRKQTCPDSKRDSKMTKINFPVALITRVIKISMSPIPEAPPQVLLKNWTGC